MTVVVSIYQLDSFSLGEMKNPAQPIKRALSKRIYLEKPVVKQLICFSALKGLAFVGSIIASLNSFK
jgi:hypothetical protein